MTSTPRELSKRALELLNASDDDRITHIDKSLFIPYDSASKILNEMEELLEHPKTNRMPNLLIIGRSNNGKTEILKEFQKRHPAEDRPDCDAVYAPVVYIQSPPGPSEHIFLNNILMSIGGLVKPNESADRKLIQLLNILPKIQTKILLIDELNALLAGSVTKQRFFLNMLKYISNELQISIVAAGTIEAQYVISTEPQLKSRFPIRTIPRWLEDEKFKNLLYNFEYVLPLKNVSEFYKGELAAKLYGLCDGVIGELAKILRSAAKHAIKTKEERITIQILNNCPYVIHKSDVSEDLI